MPVTRVTQPAASFLTEEEADTEEEVARLRVEYRAWRIRAGLVPPARVMLRFQCWQALLARQCGVLFAPWGLWEE